MATVGRQLWPHIPFFKGHYQVEWHATQSVEEVLQREKIQFPPFIRQMSRVGQAGGASTSDDHAEGVKRCRKRAIEGGTLQFQSSNAWPRSAATPSGVTGSKVKAVHSHSKFRTQRVIVQGAEIRSTVRWERVAKLYSFLGHVTEIIDTLRKVCMVVKTHQAW